MEIQYVFIRIIRMAKVKGFNPKLSNTFPTKTNLIKMVARCKSVKSFDKHKYPKFVEVPRSLYSLKDEEPLTKNWR